MEAEYNRYFSDALFSGDIPQECMDVLEMMEKELMDKARVTSYSFSGNTLQLQLKMTRFGVASELLGGTVSGAYGGICEHFQCHG